MRASETPENAEAGESTSELERLIVAARMYYLEELSQSAIAKTLGVSQAKVSRMLAAARQRGIVQITVPAYNPRREQLEDALARRFKLKQVVVIRQLGAPEDLDLRAALAHFAAPIVSGWISPSSTVAISGGRTLRRLVDNMAPTEAAPGVTFVQGMGNIDETTGSYDALEIGRRLAQRWGGQFIALNTPALLTDERVCQRLRDVEQVRSVFERLGKASLALVGVGNLENSVFRERNALTPSDINKLKRSGAVGEVMGRFYDSDGQECDSPYRRRVIGIELDALRRIEQVVGVVAGGDRAEAVVAAVRGGVLDSLVIDDTAAQALLEVAHAGPSDKQA